MNVQLLTLDSKTHCCVRRHISAVKDPIEKRFFGYVSLCGLQTARLSAAEMLNQDFQQEKIRRGNFRQNISRKNFRLPHLTPNELSSIR